MDSAFNYFKNNYDGKLLEGQKYILNKLGNIKGKKNGDNKSFFSKVNEINPSYFPTLTRMPTGSGKTGVIAISTYFGNQNGSTLILTPWKNLCDQLQKDLDADFWDKNISISKEDYSKYIFKTDRMLPSKVEKYLKNKQNERFVLVGTLSGLQSLLRDHPYSYKELCEKIKLVVVDEGHYEPAVLWGRAVKNINRPTLILTATPYRNDLKLFHVKKDFVYHYEHYKAIKAPKFPLRTIIPIKLNASSTKFSDIINEFIVNWKNGFKKKLPDRNPRAIICCESKKRVMEALKIVYESGLSCKAFHERIYEDDFRNNPQLKKLFLKNVPDAKESSEEIWIHQNKLTEGLDDPRFTTILLTYPFSNDRKLVQQVGRVLRHSKNHKKNSNNKQSAIVLYCADYNFEEVWNNYLSFEKLIELTTGEHYKKIIIDFLKLQPEYEYFGQRFRKKLVPFHSSTDLDSVASSNRFLNASEIAHNQMKEEAWNSILTPPSVLVLSVKDDFNMKDFIDASTTGLLLGDSVILGDEGNEQPIINEKDEIILWIYAQIKNSNILLKRSAYEISICARFMHKVRNYLFIGDTSGGSHSDYLGTFANSSTYFDLARCINEDSIIRQASLFNTQSLNTAVRRTVRQGINLQDAPYQLTEKKYICQNLIAKLQGKNIERYFGLTTGRISDRVSRDEKRSFNLHQFIKWTKTIAGLIDSKNGYPHSFLTRYASIAKKPDTVIPFALILDPNSDPLTQINNNEDYYDNTINWRLIDEEEDVSLNITVFDFSMDSKEEDWPFVLNIKHCDDYGNNIKNTSLFCMYDQSRGHLKFKKGEETNLQVYYMGDVFSVEHFLNQRHDRYAITFRSPSLVYHNRQYFQLDYAKAEAKFSTYISKISELETVDYEKIPKSMTLRNKAKLKYWPLKSVFYVTCKNILTKNIFGEYDWIYCDDPNREIGDFIIASFKSKKIAFVHCKYGRDKNLSASVFHDLCSQAVKNLVYIRTDRTPPNISKWNRKSFWEKSKIKKWMYGARHIPEGIVLWDKIKYEILNHPSGQVEVWLVMGAGLDVNELKSKVGAENEKCEVGPLLHLLDGLVANCAEAAVKLKIFGH